MAKYRQLRTEFWSDGFILDLTPEEKYFYLYLMTNKKTSQCGIYELPVQLICLETGYHRERVIELLDRFISYKKILYSYETKEIMILNWFKYNSPNNTNAVKCVNKELNRVKSKFMIRILYDQCIQREVDPAAIFHNVHIEKTELKNCIQEEYRGKFIPLQGATKTLPSKEVINNKQEIINKKEEVRSKEEEAVKGIYGDNDFSVSSDEENSSAILDASADLYHDGICEKGYEVLETVGKDNNQFSEVLDIFNNNIHPVSPIEHEELKEWNCKFSCEVIILAIEEAVNYNARTMKYINTILNNWTNKGIKTAGEVVEDKKNWYQKKRVQPSKRDKQSSFCYFQQRDYDYALLEKQLLGIGS